MPPLLDLPAPLVLASTSRYRQAQLARLGVDFTCIKPPYDELPVAGLGPQALVDHHALAKARSVAEQPAFAGCLVLAADQGVVLDGDLLGKPGTAEAAVAQLLRMAGRDHELRTAVALALPTEAHDAGSLCILQRVVSVQVRVRPLTRAEAEAYVAHDQPLDCAGSYRIEAAGPWLFDSVRGDDPTAVEGLPLIAVAALLREAHRRLGAGVLQSADRH